MIDFPLWPNKKESWIASAILALFLFLLYYLLFYPFLQDIYNQQFWIFPKETPSTNISSAKLDFRIPKYVADFTSRDIQIHILNGSEQFSERIIVKAEIDNLSDLGTAAPSPIIYLAAFQDQENVYNGTSVVLSRKLPPRAYVNQIVSIRAENVAERTEIDLDFYVGDEKLVSLETPNRPTFDRFATLTHSFIQIFLLPPWSNGIVPILALMITVFLEDYLQPSSNRWSMLQLRSWFNLLIGGLLFLSAIIFLPIWGFEFYEWAVYEWAVRYGSIARIPSIFLASGFQLIIIMVLYSFVIQLAGQSNNVTNQQTDVQPYSVPHGNIHVDEAKITVQNESDRLEVVPAPDITFNQLNSWEQKELAEFLQTHGIHNRHRIAEKIAVGKKAGELNSYFRLAQILDGDPQGFRFLVSCIK
ncbi:MAG: hypothetical protein DWQ07_25750 [Chloroflexi bacterium]|nr:MAG: hypothetical protein DWQ07_25750 [Chloroflexota bacterium]